GGLEGHRLRRSRGLRPPREFHHRPSGRQGRRHPSAHRSDSPARLAAIWLRVGTADPGLVGHLTHGPPTDLTDESGRGWLADPAWTPWEGAYPTLPSPWKGEGSVPLRKGAKNEGARFSFPPLAKGGPGGGLSRWLVRAQLDRKPFEHQAARGDPVMEHRE